MSQETRLVRDPFAFSLGAIAAINSYAMVPAIADDEINTALQRRHPGAPKPDSHWIRRLEDFLARYYAGERCETV